MRAARLVAVLEILLCSDFLTQFAIGETLRAFGLVPTAANGELSMRFVVALLLTDTVLLIGMILFLLRAHGERPRDVFLGTRPIAGEIRLGVPMTLAAFFIAIAVLGSIQFVA